MYKRQALTDTITKEVEIQLSETLSLTDSVSKDPSILLTESLLLTDNVSKAINILLTESVLLAHTTDEEEEEGGGEEGEEQQEEREPQEMTESISFTDSITKAVEIQLTETLELIGTTTKAVEIPLSETLSLTVRHPSAPTNIVAKDHETDDDVFTMIENAHRVDTFTIGASTYAIVTSPSDSGTDGVQIIDVSDPNNIVAKDTLADSNSLAVSYTHLTLPTILLV